MYSLNINDIEKSTKILETKFILRSYDCVIVTLLIFSIYFYFFANLFTHALLCFGFHLGFLLIRLISTRIKINLNFLVHFQNFFIMAIIIITFFLSGGTKALSTFWIPIMAFSTLNLLDWKNMVAWLSGALGIVLCFLIAELLGVEFNDLQSEANRSVLTFVHLVLMSLYTVAISLLVTKKNTEYSRIQLSLIESIYHQNRLKSLGEIVAGVGHEINNPLSIAFGNVVKLKKQVEQGRTTPDDTLNTLQTIDKAHIRINDIVKSLKTYYRKDGEATGTTDLDLLLNETISFVKHEFSDKGILLNSPESNLNLEVEGDFTMIQQVLMNLLSNARDALEGKEDKIIDIIVEDISVTTATIVVRDNGHGIPDEILDKVLSPFFTTKGVNKGTGLGLSIINNIVTALGSTLNIESKVDIGTSVKFRLNLTQSKK